MCSGCLCNVFYSYINFIVLHDKSCLLNFHNFNQYWNCEVQINSDKKKKYLCTNYHLWIKIINNTMFQKNKFLSKFCHKHQQDYQKLIWMSERDSFVQCFLEFFKTNFCWTIFHLNMFFRKSEKKTMMYCTIFRCLYILPTIYLLRSYKFAWCQIQTFRTHHNEKFTLTYFWTEIFTDENGKLKQKSGSIS